jgi:hypothetical protein
MIKMILDKSEKEQMDKTLVDGLSLSGTNLAGMYRCFIAEKNR